MGNGRGFMGEGKDFFFLFFLLEIGKRLDENHICGMFGYRLNCNLGVVCINIKIKEK